MAAIKKTVTKKPLPKAQFGTGSGPLGLPNFEERQKRKVARAERKAEVANIQGYDNVANKRNTRSSNASKILGTGRSKARTIINSGNNAGNTIDSYNTIIIINCSYIRINNLSLCQTIKINCSQCACSTINNCNGL